MKPKRTLYLLPIASLIPLSLFLLLYAPLLANGPFSDSGQTLGGDITYDVALADLDGDADLDAFTANALGNRVWLNQGGLQNGEAGIFANSGQSPGLLDSRGVALGDVDGNQTLDAFVVNNGERELWLNEGAAQFTLDQQLPSANGDGQDVALGHLNGDSALDAFVVNHGPNEVWLNDGSGGFSLAQSDLGAARSKEVALGDLNGDGAVDAYVANGSTGALADEIWLNDGDGHFTLSQQPLDLLWNEGVGLGDLDGDGDLDVFLAAWFGDDSVWINQGGAQNGQEGLFLDSGQSLSGSSSTDVALLDVDDDQDLDAVVARWLLPNEVWLNNGQGQFAHSGQALDESATYETAVGDMDVDGDPDLFFANNGADHVWVMGGFRLPQAWFDVDAQVNPAQRAVYPWAKTGPAVLPVALGFPAPQPLAVDVRIETGAATFTETVSFGVGQQADELAVENPGLSASEWVSLTLSAPNPAAQTRRPQALANPLYLLFAGAEEGPVDCFFCTADWLLKLLGFEPSFWMLHHYELADLKGTPSWAYYAGLGQGNTAELSSIIFANPTLLWQTYEVLQLWTPAVGSYDEGQGANVILTAEMMAQTEDWLNAIAGEADPSLAAVIDRELGILNPASMAGMNMSQVTARVRGRVESQLYLPVLSRP